MQNVLNSDLFDRFRLADLAKSAILGAAVFTTDRHMPFGLPRSKRKLHALGPCG